MGHPKMNGSTPSLDVRIASALASDVVNKTELTALLTEADAALAEAQRTINTESERALDISNTDPDTSDDLVRKAERTSARLQKALPRLRGRIQAIELYEHNQAWQARMDAKRTERDLLAEELAELYAPFLNHITDLYQRIDKNTAAISDLHRQAPAGENRRLLDAELVARRLTSYDAAHPRLRDNLKLPDFIRASVVAFPPDPMQTWNAFAAQANEAMRQRMVAKFSLTTGDNWHAGRDLAVEQQEAEHAKRDAELQAKGIADRAEYERKMQENDKHRRLGGG